MPPVSSLGGLQTNCSSFKLELKVNELLIVQNFKEVTAFVGLCIKQVHSLKEVVLYSIHPHSDTENQLRSWRAV